MHRKKNQEGGKTLRIRILGRSKEWGFPETLYVPGHYWSQMALGPGGSRFRRSVRVGHQSNVASLKQGYALVGVEIRDRVVRPSSADRSWVETYIARKAHPCSCILMLGVGTTPTTPFDIVIPVTVVRRRCTNRALGIRRRRRA